MMGKRQARIYGVASTTLALAFSTLASQATVSFKAAPNQTASFPTGVFLSSAAGGTTGGIGLAGPYTGKNGTVTICDGNILYTPASGFVGTDTFNVSVTNSTGGVSSALATVAVQPVPTLVMQPGNGAQIQLFGAAGTTYNIQASTNFVNWTTIGSSVADATGTVLFNDTNAVGFLTRYYRLSAP